MARILVADDNDIVRRGLKALLEERPGWQICGEALNSQAAVELAGELRPDVAITDLMTPELHGLDATRQIRSISPLTQVLVFTRHHTEALVRDALAAGARGYLLKTETEQQIVAAVEALIAGRTYFSASISEQILLGFLSNLDHSNVNDIAAPRLTRREIEVIRLLAEGHSNKKIAEKLGISVKTVDTHRTKLMRKINVNSVVEVVRYAVRNRLSVI